MSSFEDLARKAILTQPVYVPGKPIEIVAQEFGLDPQSVLKLASNENPLGASPRALEAIRKHTDSVWLYPEDSAFFLKKKLSQLHGVNSSQLIVGHGSSEIISLLANAFLNPGDEVVMGAHAFISYKLATLLNEATPVEVPMPDLVHDLDAMRAAVTDKTKLVFLPSPNNPTGLGNPAEDIIEFARSLPDHVIFCFDGAYIEYLENPPNLVPLIEEGRKVIITRTFSKIYGLAGLRVGYGIASEALIKLLNQVRPPFNVNSLGLTAALAALDDYEFVSRSREVNSAGLDQIRKGCAALGLESIPSEGNFLLVRFKESDKVFAYLQACGIIVRPVKGYGLPQYLRISVGTAAQNERLLEALAKYGEGL